MDKTSPPDLRSLIERLARLAASADWAGDLNPTQMSALRYLDRANAYSRAPSNVADYLGTTRGTVSQTLLALERKGLVKLGPGSADKRRLSYDLTDLGRALIAEPKAIDDALGALDDGQAEAMSDALAKVLTSLLRDRGGRSFGICKTCQHHAKQDTNAWCKLLQVSLSEREAAKICHEHKDEPPLSGG